MTATTREEEELATALSQILDNYALTIRTITVGSVVSYDSTTQTAEVQPLLKRKLDTDEEAQLPPVIGEVMVGTFGNGVWTATFDLQPGTNVILGMCDRSIQSWKVNGGAVDPLTPRHHKLTDAIILGVVNPKPKAGDIVTPGPGMEIRKVDGSLRVRMDDAVYISDATNDIMKVETSGVSVIGNLTVDGDIEATGAIAADGEVTALALVPAAAVNLSTHVHTSAAPGNPTSTPTPGT